jgi:SAM-dependent methyltransferase
VSRLTLVTTCRSCGTPGLRSVLSLGRTPLANSLLSPDGGQSPTFPLTLVRCTTCGLVQLAEIVDPEDLFSEYVYFSSNSDTMLRHAEAMVEHLISQESLGQHSLVVELASNDGYLLQYFKQRGVPVLGIEPAANIARVAEAEKGIPTLAEFFGRDVAEAQARAGNSADVIIGNNVLAHVPDLNDFIGGVGALLKPTGVAVFEVPYLRDMLEKVEFDTIYHEHQCYFSLTSLQHAFRRHGLEVIDVERMAIHGGSLRVSVAPNGRRPANPRVHELVAAEAAWGVMDDPPYEAFARSVAELKTSLVELLDGLKAGGARLAAYGAAAKGVTLTSYCGIGRNYLEYVVDRSPHKQGQRFPVDALPICDPARLAQDRPDYALLLTWNFADEILRQQADYRHEGGKFIVPVPRPRIVDATQEVSNGRDADEKR